MKIVNKTGYLKGAKTAKNPVNIIPSNLITTQGMAFPIKANGKTLYPNTGQYKFNTPYVVETPLKQDGSSAVKSFLSAINPKNWGVTDYSNKKDFNSAYSSAKKAGKEEFMWNGKRYNTKYAGTPRQEIGAYGAQGKTVNTKYINDPAQVNLYPPSSKYPPGHIAASIEDNQTSVDYSRSGNYPYGLRQVKNADGKSFNIYGQDNLTFSNKVVSLPTGKYGIEEEYTPSTWNLFTNNCADNVCDAFGIPRSKGIQTPSEAMSKIKEKYPTLDVTGRTYEDYENLYDEMQNQSNEKVLSQAKNIIGIANSPEIQRTGLGHKLISNIQGVLEQEGYKLPKSTKEDGSYDGKFGDETKAALEDYLKKKSKKISKKQDGADELKASEAAKFTYRIKDKKRRDTQVADMYNNTLDSFRGDTTGAKRHFKSFFTDYGSERFDGVRPLEGYYGFDRKDYDDKTLDSLGRNWHKKMKVSKKQKGVEETKANLGPTVENAKKLKSKGGPQLFPTPTLGIQKAAINKFANNPANKFDARKVKNKRATGAVDMTMSPVDLAIAGGAGLVGGTVRLASSVLPYFNAPLTVGSKVFPSITAGNILSSGFAADAMVNRLSQVPGQIKRGEYGAATENVFTGGLDLLGAGMFKSSPIKFGSKSKIKYGVNPNTNVSNKVEANAVIKPKINFEDLKKSIKKDFSPDDFTNAVTEKFTYRDPHTNEIIYQLDPEDYNNFTNPDDIKLAKSHFDEYVNEHKANIARGQEEVVNEAKRIITPKQPLLKSKDFHTNSEVREAIKNEKKFEDLEKEINEINPNIGSEEELQELFLIRPDLEKKWYDLAEEGKYFGKKFLSPSQQKYLDKQRGYVSGTSKPLLMTPGSKVNETLHPSPQDLKEWELKNKFPIRFGPGSMNKEGNKNLKSNLIKYKNGSKSVSLAFSRGEKDPKGGLTQKGVDKYNRATGGNLKMAVTTPPSKLKPGSKAANRRKSFCARMSGVKGPMMKNGKPTRKALALRKWNC